MDVQELQESLYPGDDSVTDDDRLDWLMGQMVQLRVMLEVTAEVVEEGSKEGYAVASTAVVRIAERLSEADDRWLESVAERRRRYRYK